jgi:hypothetical protein
MASLRRRFWTDPLSHRGITRITVTVVVIMFELTGALTYILPTMVSLLRQNLPQNPLCKEFDMRDLT